MRERGKETHQEEWCGGGIQGEGEILLEERKMRGNDPEEERKLWGMELESANFESERKFNLKAAAEGRQLG